MKIYVASSWRNSEQPSVVDWLRDFLKHEVYDFRHPHLGPGKGAGGFHWSEIDPDWQQWSLSEYRDALRHPLARNGFCSDQAGMEWADACVLVMPCGRSAHLEAGFMAGAGKPVFVLLRDDEPELMYGLLTRLCVDYDELESALHAPEEQASG